MSLILFYYFSKNITTTSTHAQTRAAGLLKGASNTGYVHALFIGKRKKKKTRSARSKLTRLFILEFRFRHTGAPRLPTPSHTPHASSGTPRHLVFDAGERLAEGESLLPRARGSGRGPPCFAADAVALAELERGRHGGAL